MPFGSASSRHPRRNQNEPPNCTPTSVLLVLKMKFYTQGDSEGRKLRDQEAVVPRRGWPPGGPRIASWKWRGSPYWLPLEDGHSPARKQVARGGGSPGSVRSRGAGNCPPQL